MESLAEKFTNDHDFLVFAQPSTLHCGAREAWTPRRELLWWLRRKLRALGGELRLMLRVCISVALGDRRRCNLVLDELIVREEVGIR